MNFRIYATNLFGMVTEKTVTNKTQYEKRKWLLMPAAQKNLTEQEKSTLPAGSWDENVSIRLHLSAKNLLGNDIRFALLCRNWERFVHHLARQFALQVWTANANHLIRKSMEN